MHASGFLTVHVLSWLILSLPNRWLFRECQRYSVCLCQVAHLSTADDQPVVQDAAQIVCE